MKKRLIDANAIARKLKNAHCAECNVVRKVQCSACWVNDVLELLDGDSVDAVEVVRCKDCKHFYRDDEFNRAWCGYDKCVANEVAVNGYCYRGERKDDHE